MKRFLSMLAMAVLVGQSSVTSLVYASDIANPSEESDSVSVAEAAVVDEETEGNSDVTITDFTNIGENLSTPADNFDEVEGLGENTPTVEIPTEDATPEGSSIVVNNNEEPVEVFEPLQLGLNLAPRLFADAKPGQPDFARFTEKWNNAKSCDGVEDKAGCVDEPQQSSLTKSPEDTLGEGEVGMWKLVQPTDNPGEYEISIAVKGQPKEEVVNNKVCAAVVFDKSNSMTDVEGKWESAVQGAIAFSQTLKDANNQSYIGLVIFGTNANQARSLSNNAFVESDFGGKPNGSDDGGTNLHAGLIEANNMLKSETCNDATKYIVVMSDGVPTFFMYNGERKGNGGEDVSVCVEWGGSYCKKYMKPSEAAINYANSIRSGVEIFTVGYEINNNQNAQETLKAIADDNDHFFLGNASSVANQFSNIADTISKPAGTDAHVVDNLGESITISYGDKEYVFDKITPQGHVHTFTVRIDPTIEGYQKTNAGATLTYVDVNGSDAELKINETASVNWVLPTCSNKPEQVDGMIISSVEKFTQSWGNDGKLTPTNLDWSYTESTTLGVCEWTCDTGYEYDADNNTCKKQTHTVIVNPNCEGDGCEVITTGDIEHGTKITLPTLERKYTLIYDENGNVENKLNPVSVQAELLGYCKGTTECTDVDMKHAGDEVEITSDVTYYAIWNEDSLTVIVETGAGYETPETVFTFKEWTNGSKIIKGGDSFKLLKDEALVAVYESDAQKYEVTFIDGDNITTGSYEYGTMPKAPEFTKEGDASCTKYEGKWSPEIVEVTEKATYTAEYKCRDVATYLVTFVNEDGTVLQSGDVEYGVTPKYEGETNPTKTGEAGYVYTFAGWTPELTGVTEAVVYTATYNQSCAEGYHKSGETCVKDNNGGGGGGGGGGSSSSYSCKNLPDNAVANNTYKPNRNTDYTYSEEKDAVCTFQCKSGYTRNEKDGTCDKSGGTSGGGGNNEEEIELGGQVSDKCSVEGSNRSEEEKEAYLYACENDITTIRDIEKARLGDFLTRAEMAKMISVFATKELGMKPNTSKDCSNFADSIASYNQEMKDYMVMACQLEIMGIHTTNYEAIPDFMPSKRVSRAEFGTVLSRILWGDKYEGTNSNYYVNHLNALKESNIITNINPNITEYRAWVFLMLYRSVEAIKLAKSATNETVEEQVNEELQEEGKAETGLVTEYDSGSIVPEIATETESGTLATGTVAEIETGSTIDVQTGDAETLTGDIAKDETEIGTESTEIETGSAND